MSKSPLPVEARYGELCRLELLGPFYPPFDHILYTVFYAEKKGSSLPSFLLSESVAAFAMKAIKYPFTKRRQKSVLY